jgi:hypothetical protein
VLDVYLGLLPQWPLAFIQLAPSLEVVRRRDAGRDKSVFEIWGHLDADLRAMPRAGLWLETDTDTPDQTVDRIMGSLDAATLS